MLLKGSVALVTGGASGLGEATVRRFVAAGAKVGILDLNAEKGQALAAELGDATRFFAVNVADAEGVERALDGVVEAFGALHAAVNCAGIGIGARTLNKDGSPHELARFKQVIEVNLVGSFNVLRLAAARMARNAPNEGGERGVLINTASIAAFDGQIGQAAYSASKGGIVGMTLPVARDLAVIGIRCMTIAPGTFDTPMMAMVPPAMKQALGAQIPFPSRLGDPAEYASLAAEIVTNPYLNGTVIRLDGAIRMSPK